MRVLRSGVRGAFPQLTRSLGAALAIALLAAGSPASAANPTPRPTPPRRIDVTKIQPKELAPKAPLHVEYMVEVNYKGQVARVRSVKPSHNPPFDAMTYGNVLQTFIRTPDGNAVAGTYRMIYDYKPNPPRVDRSVQLVKRGGVNPNAIGAVDDMMDKARRNRNRTPPPGLTSPPVTPAPAPSVNIHRMPDLPQVMKSPSPSPGH